MSLFQSISLKCPACGASTTMDAVGSVNADRRPDFRDDILEDRFQDTTCTECGESFRLQPDFNYLDFGRGQWIVAKPAADMPDFREIEAEVETLWAQTYGEAALPSAQELGRELTPRLTFGWPALREKIYARAHDLDDVTLEMVKVDLLRRIPDAPLAPGTEMRLESVAGDQFTFAWLDSQTETLQQRVGVNRKSYDAMRENAQAWQPIRDRIDAGSFVDMQRTFMGTD